MVLQLVLKLEQQAVYLNLHQLLLYHLLVAYVVKVQVLYHVLVQYKHVNQVIKHVQQSHLIRPMYGEVVIGLNVRLHSVEELELDQSRASKLVAQLQLIIYVQA